MDQATELEAARAAYHAYGVVTGFKNHLGKSMPSWDELPENIRRAWKAAAQAAGLRAIAAQTVKP